MDKVIKIKRLEMVNFKGVTRRVLELDGADCDIRGANGAGKTTHYDAVCWVLFGKDSRGNAAGDRSDFQIKPIGGEGQPEVKLTLSVNGEDVELRKVYKEVWTRKRGAAESTYSGNTTECYMDGVPMKINDYDARVGMVVDENEWRLLTNVYWFPRDMEWRKRRAMLYDLCGVASDEKLLDEFDMRELAADLGKHSIDDYKAKLRAERLTLNKTLEALPIRIDEQERAVSELREIDFAALRKQLDAKRGEADALRDRLAAMQHSEAEGDAANRLKAAKIDLEALERENRMHRAAQEVSVPDGREALKREILHREKEREEETKRMEADERRLEKLSEEQDRTRAHIDMTELTIAEYRREWDMENRRKMSEKDATCPTCGRVLPAELFAKAKEDFENAKEKNKAKIVRDSVLLKASVNADREKLGVLAQEGEWLDKVMVLHRETIAKYEAELKTLWAKLEDDKEPEKKPVADMEGYEERREALEAVIKATEQEIEALRNGKADMKAETTRAMIGADAACDALARELAKEDMLRKAEQRADELRQGRAELGAALNRVDAMLFQCEEFLRRKAEKITGDVNGLFKRATFRLFREQVNGGLEEVCDVMLDGKPYGTLSDGEKIKLGLDVIDGLSVRMGARLPLFVDGAESVTDMPRLGTQTITLTVDENHHEVVVK